MADVDIAQPDYTARFAKEELEAEDRLAKAQLDTALSPDAKMERIAALQDQLTKRPQNAPSVKRYANIPMRCSAKGCAQPDFTASFPEAQRIVECPSCGREVHVDPPYGGTP